MEVEKCEYCDLVSGEEKDIGEAKNDILKIERHRNSYYISAIDEVYTDEIEIKYCPMCGRKLV